MLAAVLIAIFGGFILSKVGGAVGAGAAVGEVWRYGQYVVAIFFIVLAVALLYRFGPAVENPKWHWITPGATLAVLIWILCSVGLRIYLHFSNSYAKSYGSLGAVIILMLWFYLSGMALLVGAEVNSEIEHAAAERGRADADRKGAERLAA
jgi:membrane protein